MCFTAENSKRLRQLAASSSALGRRSAYRQRHDITLCRSVRSADKDPSEASSHGRFVCPSSAARITFEDVPARVHTCLASRRVIQKDPITDIMGGKGAVPERHTKTQRAPTRHARISTKPPTAPHSHSKHRSVLFRVKSCVPSDAAVLDSRQATARKDLHHPEAAAGGWTHSRRTCRLSLIHI